MYVFIHVFTSQQKRVVSNENEMFESIFQKIKDCIELTNVQHKVFIAIDGPAPRAKMEQQRQRRLKSSQEVKDWDTNAITPGTQFMEHLNKFLKKQIKFLSVSCILSDSNEPGEGEHKIMKFIDNTPIHTTHYVYGLDAYLNQLTKIDPTLNDFLSNVSYPKHIQPNVYSESYYQKIHKLNQDYLKLIQKKTQKTRYDKLLRKDILYSIHLEDDYEIFMYMPIDLYNNKLIDYVTECSGNGYYQFNQPSDYTHFMKRMKTLTPMTNEIILKMRDGIKHKITLYEKIVDAMIEQIQTILKTKSYQPKKVSFKQKWDKHIQTYLVSNLNRLLSFLLNEYYPHSSQHCGLQSYKKGKQYYRSILHNEL
tara:strand:+ start:9 stop:1103 length:1095 start_codon:yes stop_codon:yes gene_type:complete